MTVSVRLGKEIQALLRQRDDKLILSAPDWTTEGIGASLCAMIARKDGIPGSLPAREAALA
jgi:hypothetical protein